MAERTAFPFQRSWSFPDRSVATRVEAGDSPARFRDHANVRRCGYEQNGCDHARLKPRHELRFVAPKILRAADLLPR